MPPITAHASRTIAGVAAMAARRFSTRSITPTRKTTSSWPPPATARSTTDVSANYPSAYNLPNIILRGGHQQRRHVGVVLRITARQPSPSAHPGVGIYSTLPNNGYGSLSGTSMATPHVTGTVGLLLSLHPTWSVSQIINQVLSTVTPDPNLVRQDRQRRCGERGPGLYGATVLVRQRGV